jgi:molybdopterin biosynthesis enzyme
MHLMMRQRLRHIVYGTPVLPGAILLYGRLGSIPVLGLPACVLFYKATVFDLVLPRVLAGEDITREDLASMGPRRSVPELREVPLSCVSVRQVELMSGLITQKPPI